LRTGNCSRKRHYETFPKAFYRCDSDPLRSSFEPQKLIRLCHIRIAIVADDSLDAYSGLLIIASVQFFSNLFHHLLDAQSNLSLQRNAALFVILSVLQLSIYMGKVNATKSAYAEFCTGRSSLRTSSFCRQVRDMN
jgi:hypothetical protein